MDFPELREIHVSPLSVIAVDAGGIGGVRHLGIATD
jgi:hypothetical protein